MILSAQILHTLQSFAILFAEISLLFIGIDMLTSYINKRYSNAIQKHLSANAYTSYLKAIVLGAITPFCSCSTIPFFQSLLRSGVALSVSFAYLLTSPLINPIILAMLFMTFGFTLGLSYMCFVIIAVLLLALSLKNANVESLLKKEFLTNTTKPSCCEAKSPFSLNPKPTSPLLAQNQAMRFHAQATHIESKKPFKPQNTFQSLFLSSLRNYKKILPYIAVGMAIGAFLHDFIPQEALQEVFAHFHYLGVILAAMIGIFLYIRVEAIIPIGLGLINAGVPLGVVMSLLIAGGGCSLPELIVLKSMFKMKLLCIFIAMVLAISIGFGILVLLFGA